MVFLGFPAMDMNIKYFPAAVFLFLFSFLCPPFPVYPLVGSEEGVGPGTDMAVE